MRIRESIGQKFIISSLRYWICLFLFIGCMNNESKLYIIEGIKSFGNSVTINLYELADLKSEFKVFKYMSNKIIDGYIVNNGKTKVLLNRLLGDNEYRRNYYCNRFYILISRDYRSKIICYDNEFYDYKSEYDIGRELSHLNIIKIKSGNLDLLKEKIYNLLNQVNLDTDQYVHIIDYFEEDRVANIDYDKLFIDSIFIFDVVRDSYAIKGTDIPRMRCIEKIVIYQPVFNMSTKEIMVLKLGINRENKDYSFFNQQICKINPAYLSDFGIINELNYVNHIRNNKRDEYFAIDTRDSKLFIYNINEFDKDFEKYYLFNKIHYILRGELYDCKNSNIDLSDEIICLFMSIRGF